MEGRCWKGLRAATASAILLFSQTRIRILLVLPIQLQEADLSEGGHSGPGLLLALEVDLYREPVGDRSPLWETLQGAPHTARVQELPLAPV